MHWLQITRTPEEEFTTRRQQLGLLELVETDPKRVAEFCGQLLHLTELQDALLANATRRITELELGGTR